MVTSGGVRSMPFWAVRHTRFARMLYTLLNSRVLGSK